LHFRGWSAALLPDSIQIKDLRLKVLQEHWFKRNISFNDYPDTVALSELIEPGFLWRVLVMAHGEPLYEFWLNSRTGKPIIQQSNIVTRQHPIWVSLLEAYPEPTEINPTLIVYSGPRRQYFFLYFKQLGPRKIHYSSRSEFNLTFDSLFTASIGTLDDSKILIRYLKEREISERTGGTEEFMPQGDTQSIERTENSDRQIERPAIFIEGNLMRDFPPAKSNQ
jgi:hypothetical protein